MRLRLALAALGLALAASVGLRVWVSLLGARVSEAERRVEKANAAVAELAAARDHFGAREDLAVDRKRLDELERTVGLLKECLPELQSYVDGLEYDVNYDYISSRSQLSRRCSPLLYPSVTGPSEAGD